MNYIDFANLMNTRNLPPTEHAVYVLCDHVKALNEIVERQTKTISDLTQIIKGNSRHIELLQNELLEMFPQKETIDILYDDDEERRKEILRRYVNTNPNFEDDAR